MQHQKNEVYKRLLINFMIISGISIKKIWMSPGGEILVAKLNKKMTNFNKHVEISSPVAISYHFNS